MSTLAPALDVDVPDNEKTLLMTLSKNLSALLDAKRSGSVISEDAILHVYTALHAESRRLQLQVLSGQEYRRNHLGQCMIDFLQNQCEDNPTARWLLHALGEAYAPPDKEAVLKAFKAEVYDRQQVIDPEDQRGWDDMAYGFALARGCSPEMASEIGYQWYAFVSADPEP